MPTYFVGVDVAGQTNTWSAVLSAEGGVLELRHPPVQATLNQIALLCSTLPAAAIAIDAQLSLGVADENGFRASDQQLRELLPPEFANWVASFNSLMAVPVRGRLIAEAVAPFVGTVLETHPRASLLLGLGEGFREAIAWYKPRNNESDASYLQRGGLGLVLQLWSAWIDRFDIAALNLAPTDGQLDALVCVTVAALYHRHPEVLLRLTRHNPDGVAYGRGPFYVLQPR